MTDNYYTNPTYQDLIRELSNQERTIDGIEMQLSDVENDNLLLGRLLETVVTDLEALKDVPFGLVHDSISEIIKMVKEVQ